MVIFDVLSAGRMQQDLKNRQARLLKIAANDAIRRGDLAERTFRRDGGSVIGAQRAAFGAGNIALDTGSAVEVQETTQRVLELDALQIRNNAAREAWGLRTQMRFVKFEADVAWQQAKVKAFTNVVKIAAAFFTGGASLLATGGPEGGGEVGADVSQQTTGMSAGVGASRFAFMARQRQLQQQRSSFSQISSAQ